jgi:hypothetical protein
VVTLWADEDVGTLTPDEPELFELPEVAPEAAPEAEVEVECAWLDDWDTWVVDGVAACDDPEAAKTAVPPVSAMATPAIPAVIRLTRRRASCRRVTASLGLGRAS